MLPLPPCDSDLGLFPANFFRSPPGNRQKSPFSDRKTDLEAISKVFVIKRRAFEKWWTRCIKRDGSSLNFFERDSSVVKSELVKANVYKR